MHAGRSRTGLPLDFKRDRSDVKDAIREEARGLIRFIWMATAFQTFMFIILLHFFATQFR